ncbi:LptF/LptG family permease [Blattabacterium cuenoti]|uniref:LptF/LptG family permease n=1 Tax=Blattabacterium cuenoti TaxID=1653831 RepID=UPI001EEB3C97|nr:LptF/LptG family permease [Blattabacterium cuenoti]
MIKKLDFYMVRLFIEPFFIVFLSIFVLFLIQFFWSQIDELTGKNIDIIIIIKFIYYFGIIIFPIVIPIVILLTSLITFGNLSEKKELFVIQSSGISFFRIMLPVFIVSLILSLVSYFFSDFFIPKAHVQIRKLGDQISLSSPSLIIKEGIFVNICSNVFIKVDKKIEKQNQNRLQNVFIFFHNDDNSIINTILAKQGFINTNKVKKYVVLKLRNGFLYSGKFDWRNHYNDKKNTYYQIAKFKTLIQKFPIPSYQEKNRENDHESYKFLDTKSLIKRIKFLNKKQIHSKNFTYEQKIYLYKTQLELQKKFTFPITCLIMFFIGSSLGSIIKKGGILYPTIISLSIFICYYILITITQNEVEKGNLIPWIGAWTTNLIFFPISIGIIKVAINNKLS